MSEQKRAHVWISGRVQGVFFRATTRKKADKRKVTGWVTNLSDGRVEAVFEGRESQVQRMVDWCQEGPPQASVEEVEVQWGDATGEFDRFRVRR